MEPLPVGVVVVVVVASDPLRRLILSESTLYVQMAPVSSCLRR